MWAILSAYLKIQRVLIAALVTTATLISFVATASDDEPCSDYLKVYRECKSSWRKKPCAADLLTEYTYILYRNVNAHLRNQKIDPVCGKLADIIASDLAKLPPTGSLKVYRGNMNHYAGLDSLKPGDCYSDLGFLSTSRSCDAAKGFALAELFEIESFSGRDVSRFSQVPSEQEVLFLPRTLFRYEGMDDHTVRLKEISSSTQCRKAGI